MDYPYTPHPLCNHDAQVDKPNFLKILPCVVFLCAFPHNDIVVFTCRHLYHPWCALIRFRQVASVWNHVAKQSCPQSGIKVLDLKSLIRKCWRKKRRRVVRKLNYINCIYGGKLH
jgi:hypothetical protein